MPSKYQPGGTGFNGQTGAKATFNEGTGMWVDTAGQQIRDDAIAGGPPSTPQAASSAGQPAVAGSGSTIQDTGMSSGAGGAGGAMAGLQAAMPQSVDMPSVVNPLLLGQRLPPSNASVLAGLRNIY